jgi:hypothetical protein
MVLAAFMLVTASLSMVFSNTACAIKMVPIAGAMCDAIDNITGKRRPCVSESHTRAAREATRRLQAMRFHIHRLHCIACDAAVVM